MAFYFGIINEIPSGLGTAGFVVVIFFLLAFEGFTVVLESLEEDHYAAYQMVQTVYKELMIMGVVSFIIIMLESNDVFEDKDAYNWMISIDFAHIALFFSALFYVAHAVYFIYLTISMTRQYRRRNAYEVKSIIEDISNYNEKYDSNSSKYSPITIYNQLIERYNIMQNIDFKLNYFAFTDTYQYIPLNFDFSHYLTLCTEHYILELLEVGIVNRFILATVVVMNYVRVQLMASTQSSECLKHQNDIRRHLAGGGDVYFKDVCVEQMLVTFTAAGYALIAWNIFLIILCNLYSSRLRDHRPIGHEEHPTETSDMYYKFLISKMKEYDRKVEEVAEKERDIARRLKEQEEKEEIEMLHLMEQMISPYNGFEPKPDYENDTVNTSDGDTKNNIKSLSIKANSELLKRVKSRPTLDESSSGKKKSFSVHMMKANIDELKRQKEESKVSPVRWIEDKISHCVTFLMVKIQNPKKSNHESSILRNIEKQNSIVSAHSNTRGSFTGIQPNSWPHNMDEDSDAGVSPQYSPSHMSKSLGSPLNSSGQGNKFVSRLESAQDIDDLRDKLQSNGRQGSDLNSASDPGSTVSNAVGEGEGIEGFHSCTMHEKNHEFNNIYTFCKFNTKSIFFNLIEFSMMLNCLWLAMWATNYITLAKNAESDEAFWQCLLIVPFIVIMPLLGYVVKASAKLMAITTLNMDASAKVLEMAEEVELLLNELRAKLKSQIDVLADKRSHTEIITDLFNEVDLDGSGQITKVEFRHLLLVLNLHFSNQKLNHLFYAVDRDKSGSITVEEFREIMFGDEIRAKEAAQNDMSKRRSSVSKHMAVLSKISASESNDDMDNPLGEKEKELIIEMKTHINDEEKHKNQDIFYKTDEQPVIHEIHENNNEFFQSPHDMNEK